jgi:hypothetical protein
MDVMFVLQENRNVVPARLKIFVNLNTKLQIKLCARLLGSFQKLAHTNHQNYAHLMKDFTLCLGFCSDMYYSL